MMLITGLAPILAPILGSALLAFGGWRLNFWFMTAFGTVIGLAAVLRLKESRSQATALHARTENPFQAYAALLGQRRLVGYTLAGALNGATLFTWISASPGVIMGTYGYSAAVFPWIFGLNAVGVIGSGQVNRIVLRHWTPDQVLAWSSVIALFLGIALALATITGLGGRWTVLPLLFLLLSSFGFMQGNTAAGALNVDPIRSGSIAALLGTTSVGTGALASSLAALFHDATPRAMALVMLVSLVGSAAALRYLAFPRPAQA
jgi:MFS transporter, DHA1 family, multidrug resistance protein